VEYVHYPFIKTELRPPPNDEIKYLGEAVLQRIQWERGYIQLNPLPMDSITGPSSGSALSQSVQPQKNVESDLEKLAEMNSKKDNVGQMEKQSKMSSKNAIAAEMDIDTQLKLSSKKATAAAKCHSEKQPSLGPRRQVPLVQWRSSKKGNHDSQ